MIKVYEERGSMVYGVDTETGKEVVLSQEEFAKLSVSKKNNMQEENNVPVNEPVNPESVTPSAPETPNTDEANPEVTPSEDNATAGEDASSGDNQ